MSSVAPVSVAPMMECTDRHFRYFLRQITRRTLLYTEMIHARRVLDPDRRERALAFDEIEHPIAIQLGGDDPVALAEASQIAVDHGYDEVNLNVGCPSKKVQKGNFGVCLMKTPEVVADVVKALMDAVDVPVSVKHRIGVDEVDRYEDMANFVEVVSQAGCTRFTVHARKAWLQGLNPRQNRNVPPLRYDDVYRLKRDFPDLVIEINGGIKTTDEIETHLEQVDAAMIGRAAYENPWMFHDTDTRFFGAVANPELSRHEAIEAMFPYIEKHLVEGERLSQIARHLFQAFNGIAGAKAFRRYMGQNIWEKGADTSVLARALLEVSRDAEFTSEPKIRAI